MLIDIIAITRKLRKSTRDTIRERAETERRNKKIKERKGKEKGRREETDHGKTLISGEGEPKDVRDELERKAREERQ